MLGCLTGLLPSYPEKLQFECPFAWAIKFGQYHALELAENGFAFNDGQHHTVAEEQAPKV